MLEGLKSVLFYGKSKLMLSLLLLLLSTIMSLLGQYLLGTYIDRLCDSGETFSLMHSGLVLFFVFSAEVMLFLFGKLFSTASKAEIGFMFKKELLDSLKSAQLSDIGKNDYAYLSNRIDSDVDVFVAFITDTLVNLVMKLIVVVAAVSILFRINSTVTFAVLPMLVLNFAPYLFFRRRLFEAQIRYKENKNLFLSELTRQIKKIKAIRVYSLFSVFTISLQYRYNEYFGALFNNAKQNSIFMSSCNFARNIVMTLLFLVGGQQIMMGKLTVGDFLIFNNYSFMIISSLATVSIIGQDYQDARSSLSRMNELMRPPKEKPLEITYSNIDSLTVRCLTAEKGNCETYNFHRGEATFVVGENGIGKTTLLEQILGVARINNDIEVRLNNIIVDNSALEDTSRRVMSYCEQHPDFDICIEQLRQYKIDGSTDIIEDAMKFYEEFGESRIEEDELDNYFNPSASNGASGGEIQKLALSIAFARKTDIVLLDEPTSALDFDGKTTFTNILTEAKKSKIIIVVTHDPDLLKLADRVIRI